MRRSSVILICYAIEAGRGSEQGSGYNFVRCLAEDESLDLTVITRANNVAALRSDPVMSEVHFVGHDVPTIISFWKRQGRGIIGYYYLWQIGVGRLVSRMWAEGEFDVVHQYNFHTDWAPHFLRVPDGKIIWGPICHQPLLPSFYLNYSSQFTRLKERLKWLAKNCFWRLDPNIRTAIRATDVILYANTDLAPPFRDARGLEQQTFGGAAFLNSGDPIRSSDTLHALHVGRSVEIKGAHIAIVAFSRFIEEGGVGCLTVVGEGPMRERLELLAHREGVATKVLFKDWMPQAALADVYQSANAFLYPSLGNQDSVVAEALAAGLPIICVEASGTHTMASDAALAAPLGSLDALVAGLAGHLHQVSRELRSVSKCKRTEVSQRRSGVISWAHTAASVRRHYDIRP